MKAIPSPHFFVRTAIAFAFVLTACGATSVSVDNLKVDPDTIDKGQSVAVNGKVSSFGHSISTLTYSIGNAPAGITVSNNALGTDKFNWDLRTDADLKIVTTEQAAPGSYTLHIEAKADNTSDSKDLRFTVR
jgi:uncharacterized membrane protein